ncbi:MAG: YraN family protein [Defluviitaleaceae bacterium]|nr:YraN family protein [Defluviitaleaceae bacterium]
MNTQDKKSIKTKNLIKGKSGEKLAVKFLRQKGYRILHKNYKTNLGEIDIIISDGETLIFVEVKSREGGFLDVPAEAVTAFKQRKINQVACMYLSRFQLRNVPIRFDVVEVYMSENRMEHLENAFDSYLKF